jgi:hypothetical protein
MSAPPPCNADSSWQGSNGSEEGRDEKNESPGFPGKEAMSVAVNEREVRWWRC